MSFYFKSPKILISLVVFIVFSPMFAHAETVEKYEFESDPKFQQRISILVGSAKAGEEDGTDGSDSPVVGDAPTQSTSLSACENSRCCLQYTWQGFIQDDQIPKSPANATCEVLRSQRKDDSIACFDPIVYTTGTSGNSPDIPSLRAVAQENNYNIYCPLTGSKSCMSLRYYSRGSGGNKIVNETRFCGSITDITSGNSVTSGCYKEKTQGYTREVCICKDKTFCNSSRRLETCLATILAGLLLIFFNVVR